MILLPMDAEVARALRLPRHRQTAFLRSHRAYSENVLWEVRSILNNLKEQLRKHSCPRPNYGNYKSRLEKLSKRIYKQIIAASEVDGVASLDEIEPKRFKQQPRTRAPRRGMSSSDF
jgi:hypothetical protein